MTPVSPGPLSGRLAVVTGGTRGIGAAIADRLYAAGATVVITSRSRPVESPFEHIAADLRNEDAILQLAATLRSRPVDIMINNAGINHVAPFSELKEGLFDEILSVNLRAAYLTCRAVIPGMRARGWGRIVNISSIFGVISKAGRAPYSASKFGLDGLTAAIAAEVAVDGILANCVAPGFIETDLTRRSLGDDGMKAMAELIPMRRLGQPEEIAALVAWLSGPENTYLSGQTVVIDGGFSRV